MNQQQAIRQVASHAAALLASGDFEESTGLNESDVSDTDAERLGWAVGVVINRLYRMGSA